MLGSYSNVCVVAGKSKVELADTSNVKRVAVVRRQAATRAKRRNPSRRWAAMWARETICK
jgi:hypothetical protein